MSRAICPGPASLAGLAWLARVGPAPVEAWAAVMGWASGGTVGDHIRRLERAGLLRRWPTSYGEGSLLTVTRDGVERIGLPVSPWPSRPPAPTWWSHLRACAWTAAWLTRRGQLELGSRELEGEDPWEAEIRWRHRGGWRTSGHRPDLLRTVDGVAVPVEVELQRKSTPRLQAVLEVHALWRTQGKTGGVLYVCGTERGCDRVQRLAERYRLMRGVGGLGLRTVEQVQIKARSEEFRAAAP